MVECYLVKMQDEWHFHMGLHLHHGWKATIRACMQMQIQEQLDWLLHLHLLCHNYCKCEAHVQFKSSVEIYAYKTCKLCNLHISNT